MKKRYLTCNKKLKNEYEENLTTVIAATRNIPKWERGRKSEREKKRKRYIELHRIT